MARLSVNLNKIALLRNSRRTGVPDLLNFARIAIDAGAAGITIHPRPDERHIRRDDVPALARWMKPLRPAIELNIEGYPDTRFLGIAKKVKPEQCTLVPDSSFAFTSEKGWDLSPVQMRVVRRAVASLKKSGSRVILFVDPDPEVVERVADAGADGIEIYTGGYAAAFRTGRYTSALEACVETARRAKAHNLVVNIGHDLNLHNLPPLVARIPMIDEASIGHELTADALLMGFRPAIQTYSAMLAAEHRSSAFSDDVDTKRDPLSQFGRWFAQVQASNIPQANAMALATATKSGKPSARTVLLKDFTKDGFVFYTNYKSRKGRELGENRNAALLFHWPQLERQIRITGTVRKVSRKESGTYFWSRSRESQLAAWASRQGTVIASRDVLDARMQKLREQYKGKRIPLPPYWGGYRLVPHEFEFWQGGEHRLHDRLFYALQNGRWLCTRLSP